MAYLEINLENIAKNYKIFKSIIDPNVRICAVVKNNAYGMGLKQVGKTLKNLAVEWFAVNNLQEAIILREGGILQPILILGYLNPNKEAIEAARHNCSVTLCDLHWAKEAAGYIQKFGKKLNYHLKIDTGMHRFGIYPIEIADFIDNIKHLNSLNFEGVYSHLACSNDLNKSQEQQENFNEALFKLQSIGHKTDIVHLTNTNGSLFLPDAQFDMVRIGIGLYGFCEKDIELKPVFRLKAKILSIKRVPQGAKIGYGFTFTAKRSMVIAVADIGYTDGLPRISSNLSKAILNGKVINQIGTLSMSYSMYDITGIANVKITDELIILDAEIPQINPKDFAKKIDTTIYELISRLPFNMERKYQSF